MSASFPPEYYLPEYLHVYKGTKLLVVAIFFIPLVLFFFILRIYSRSLSKGKQGWDDILIWPSLITCLVLDGLGIAMIKSAGVGHHLIALEILGHAETVVVWAKILMSIEWIYLLAVALPKICVLILYLRVFTTRTYRMTCYVLVAIIVGNFVAGGITATVGCWPIEFTWNKLINGHCINTNAFFRWISFPNVLTDVAILILPLPLVWTLHTSRNQKIGLTITFSTGSIGLIVSIIRFANFFGNDAISDGTMASVDLMTWTIVEPSMYLIAACLVTLRPLFQHLFSGTFLATIGSKSLPEYQSSSKDQKSNHIKLSSLPTRASGNIKSKGFREIENDSYGDERGLVRPEGVHQGDTGNRVDCVGCEPRVKGLRKPGIVVEHKYSVTCSK